MAAADGSVSAGEAVAKAETGEAVMSFLDGDSPADAADAVLAEVLGDGEAAAEGEPAKEGEAPAAEAAADGEPAKEPPAPETPEAVKLRKAWAKHHRERQELIEEKQQAQRAVAEAEGFRQSAQNFNYIVKKLQEDPGALLEELEATLGIADLKGKVIQGIIDTEKSPAEREVQRIRRELAERDARERQAADERTASEWRDGIKRQVESAGEEFDLVNSLGLHGQVIDVITGYHDRHSLRDAQGNFVKHAILDWKDAAKMVEDHHAERLNSSKRYGKRVPVAQVSPAATPGKDASPAKAPAPAKRAPTLSAVPVAEAPPKGRELSLDPDERFRQLMAEMHLA